MKIFDLSLKYNFTDDVQKNLSILFKKYGEKFKIKYNKIIVPVVLSKDIYRKCFSLYYDVADRSYNLFPFKILFMNIITMVNDNVSYISNIHKTDEISGSNMIKLVIKINKVLGVKKSLLFDGTTIKCFNSEHDLSFIKLLEKKTSFYMKFGFKFIMEPSNDFIKFNSNEEKHKFICNLIDKSKKIEIKEVKKIILKTLDLLNRIIKDQGYNLLKIKNTKVNDITNSWYITSNDDIFNKLLIDCKSVLDLLSKSKDKYLYKFMIKLFNDSNQCIKYDIITKLILDTKTKIIYKNIIIDYKIFDSIKLLNQLRYSFFEYIY